MSYFGYVIRGGMLATLALCAAACGGDSDDDEPARVRSLTVGDGMVAVGEIAGVDVDFSFSTDEVLEDENRVIVLVLLPAGVSYVDNSARVDSVGTNEEVDPSVESCDGGESFLRFELDDDDLFDASDPSGTADARLELDIVGISPTGLGNVEASADYNVAPGSCSGGILADVSVVITVV